MKRHALIALWVAGMAFSYGAAAGSGPSDTEMKRCFEAHARLMEKPAMRNWVICWRMHGYLMDKR